MFFKERFNLSSSVNQYVLAYFVFVLLFYGIRYTVDWAPYTQMIEHPELSPDLLFRFLAERVRGEFGFSFIYQLHIVLIGGGTFIASQANGRVSFPGRHLCH